jgi:hypothetical protein
MKGVVTMGIEVINGKMALVKKPFFVIRLMNSLQLGFTFIPFRRIELLPFGREKSLLCSRPIIIKKGTLLYP